LNHERLNNSMENQIAVVPLSRVGSEVFYRFRTFFTKQIGVYFTVRGIKNYLGRKGIRIGGFSLS
jgi:hypothetical protein